MKQQIRQDLLSFRNQFQATSFIIKSVIKNFCEVVPVAKVVAGYYPIGSELNVLPLLDSLKNNECIIALPAINQHGLLDFYEWQNELRPSTLYHKILEPNKAQEPLIPSVIIAPLIACDCSGNRIGSGKAMYDKTIAALRAKGERFLYVGVCFDFQLLEQITVETHDQKLDIIVTDQRIITR